MQINKKFFQNIFKTVSYGIFKIFYKKVEKVIDVKNNSEIQVRDVKKNGDFKYILKNFFINLHFMVAGSGFEPPTPGL